MLAAIGQAVAVAEPIEQGHAQYQKDQRTDLGRGHVVCSWCGAGGGSAWLVVFIRCVALRSGQLLVSLVGANINQRCNVADVSELRRLAAAVECDHGYLNPAADDFCRKRLLVEVSEVLHAQLVEGYQHVTEVAVQQLYGVRIRCRQQP